jgi:hypothetical protein
VVLEDQVAVLGEQVQLIWQVALLRLVKVMQVEVTLGKLAWALLVGVAEQVQLVQQQFLILPATVVLGFQIQLPDLQFIMLVEEGVVLSVAQDAPPELVEQVVDSLDKVVVPTALLVQLTQVVELVEVVLVLPTTVALEDQV